MQHSEKYLRKKNPLAIILVLEQPIKSKWIQ